MGIGAHDEQVDRLVAYGFGNDAFRIARDQRSDHLEACRFHSFLRPFQLPARVHALLSGHEQMDRQAAKQGAGGNQFDATCALAIRRLCRAGVPGQGRDVRGATGDYSARITEKSPWMAGIKSSKVFALSI
jgi:hypothetical protein